MNVLATLAAMGIVAVAGTLIGVVLIALNEVREANGRRRHGQR